MFSVRPEEDDDRDAIRKVHESAFETPAEADLVDALRGSEAWRPELSLVAEHEDGVAGHLLLSVAVLDSGRDVLALAPMAVVPDHQREGIGGALVREGLARAVRASYPLVVVVGHPGYYARFGFRPARAQGLEAPFDVPDEAWMALALPAHEPHLRGTVVYPRPFADL